MGPRCVCFDTHRNQREIVEPTSQATLGAITILFKVLEALQILPPGLEAKEEKWRYVRPEPGCAIINLSDAMVESSGGVLRSNFHRVYFAPGDQAVHGRYSLTNAIMPEGIISMKRLAMKGSAVPDLEEGGEDLECSANEWLTRKGLLSERAKTMLGADAGEL
jgi:hypothetical protein